MRKAAGSGGRWPEPDKQLPGKESWSLAAQRSVGRLSGRWICGMGQEGEQVGKIIAWQFQEEEVDRRVTGRINKDPETFNLECMGGGCRRGHAEPQAGLCLSLRGLGVAGDSEEAGQGVTGRAALWLCGERPERWRCHVSTPWPAFLFYPQHNSESEEMAESGQQIL